MKKRAQKASRLRPVGVSSKPSDGGACSSDGTDELTILWRWVSLSVFTVRARSPPSASRIYWTRSRWLAKIAAQDRSEPPPVETLLLLAHDPNKGPHGIGFFTGDGQLEQKLFAFSLLTPRNAPNVCVYAGLPRTLAR